MEKQKMNDKAKNVLGFLFMSSAFTQRNVTSVVLVMVFFGVYIAAGGKITTTLPRLERVKAMSAPTLGGSPLGKASVNKNAEKDNLPGGVGDKSTALQAVPDLTQDESQGLLGINPSEKRAARQRAVQQRGSLFTAEEREEDIDEPLDPDGLVKGADFTNRRDQWRLERAERKQTDSLSLIEERLKIRRR
jgi:hypothetical protein